MNKETAKNKIKLLIERLDNLPSYSVQGDNPEFVKWGRDVEIAIENIFGKENRHTNDFKNIDWILFNYSNSTPDSKFIEAHNSGRSSAKMILFSFIDEIEEFWSEENNQADSETVNPIKLVLNIINKFHRIAHQLTKRHSNRKTLIISDEYDAQDLFHALLLLHFDDVRPEEYTPSYAGAASRIDFLLSDEKIAVEIKKTRDGLVDKEVGEELMVDIQRYQNHPKVKKLICFVYDPEGRLLNPVALEKDLRKSNNALEVLVYIVPKL